MSVLIIVNLTNTCHECIGGFSFIFCIFPEWAPDMSGHLCQNINKISIISDWWQFFHCCLGSGVADILC